MPSPCASNHARLAFALCLVSCTLSFAQKDAPADLVIRNATVMTASHGTIEHGSVWVHQGKIAGVGATVSAPASAVVIDASGKYLTPGIIDPHSHSALGDDVNEATSPVTPSMMMIDAFDNTDRALYFALAGGVTTELLLHGSANMIGGQNVSIKNRFGRSRDEMLFARRTPHHQVRLRGKPQARLRLAQSAPQHPHGQL